MSIILFLALVTKAFACGPDFCGRESRCGEYVGNRSSVDEEYFISGCEGALTILDANNFTYQNIDLLMKEAFNYAPSEGAQALLSWSYPEAGLYAEKAQAMNFFRDLMMAEKLSADDSKALTDLRAALTKDAQEKKNVNEFAKRAEKMSSDAKGSKSYEYLLAAAEFYLGDMATARKKFEALETSALPLLSEVSAYMRARSALNEAQNGWDGYRHEEGKKPDPAALEQAEKLFREYESKFPSGNFVQSSIGLRRRIAYLREKDSEYLKLLSEDIAANESGKNPEKLYLLLREYDSKGDWKSGDPENMHPFLWLIRTYYSQRTTSEEAWEKTDREREPHLLARAQKAFGNFPDLFLFSKANLQFGAGKYAEAKATLKKIDPKKFLLPRAYTSLNANILVKQMRFREARELVATYIDKHPKEVISEDLTGENQPNIGRHLLAPLYTYIFSWENQLELAYLPENIKRVDPLELDQLTRKTLSTIRVKKIFDSLKDPKMKARVGSVLIARQIYQRSFSEALSTLNACPNTFDAGEQKKLKPVLKVLAMNPREPKALYQLADFLVGRESSVKGYQSVRSVSLCEGTKQEKADWPIHFLKTAIEGFPAKEKSDFERDALVRAITCFRTTSVSDCYDVGSSDIPVSSRKKWFQTLHKKYGDSEQASEINYYW